MCELYLRSNHKCNTNLLFAVSLSSTSFFSSINIVNANYDVYYLHKTEKKKKKNDVIDWMSDFA